MIDQEGSIGDYHTNSAYYLNYSVEITTIANTYVTVHQLVL